MRSLKLPLVALSLLALCACTTSSLTEQENAPVTGSETTFMGTMKEIDKEQSVISFTGKSNIINHEGKFTEYTATVSLDPAEPANLEKAMITAEVDVTSALTEAAGLNAHLQKEDFFAANQYPKAMFTSTRIVSKGGNLYDVTGDLILKGVMKEISLAAEITDDYLTTHYDLPRKDFGIGNDSYGDKLLEETVPVNVKLVFKK
ncbi:YceI family protein [Candidatus Peribacteria bacterium]|nr:YceI family protein [Candidatus Peribacteria bacterium]